MAKPIVVLTLNISPDYTAFEHAKKYLDNLLGDEYYNLVLAGNETKIQVFYEKDFNQVKYEELKRIIEKEVANETNKV